MFSQAMYFNIFTQSLRNGQPASLPSAPPGLLYIYSLSSGKIPPGMNVSLQSNHPKNIPATHALNTFCIKYKTYTEFSFTDRNSRLTYRCVILTSTAAAVNAFWNVFIFVLHGNRLIGIFPIIDVERGHLVAIRSRWCHSRER